MARSKQEEDAAREESAPQEATREQVARAEAARDHAANQLAPAASAIPGGPLNPDERVRLEELRKKSADTQNARLDENEQRMLDDLERRAVPQAAGVTDRLQREISPDRGVLPPREMPREDANRLRDLRVAHELGRLDDGERAEMQKLGAAESEYAGHVTPPEAGELDPGWSLVDEVVFLIEQIVALTPRFRTLEPRLRLLRQNLNDQKNPEGSAGNPPIRPSDTKAQRPGPNP